MTPKEHKNYNFKGTFMWIVLPNFSSLFYFFEAKMVLISPLQIFEYH